MVAVGLSTVCVVCMAVLGGGAGWGDGGGEPAGRPGRRPAGPLRLRKIMGENTKIMANIEIRLGGKSEKGL